MTTTPASEVPLDKRSLTELADAGLSYRVVPPELSEMQAFVEATRRGFLDERPSEEQAARVLEGADSSARHVGVYDSVSPEPGCPVATIKSWLMDLTTDTDTFLPMWAISWVTVAATHRRRGIATALIEGDLRAAADAGVPIAGLTVSEATIYERFGFGIAADGAGLTIESRRAGWRSPAPTSDSRLDYIEGELLAQELQRMHEATRGGRPGQASGLSRLWPELAGITPGKPARDVRGVRFADHSGETQGTLAYTLKADANDYTKHTLDVRALYAATDDAYAALWRYVLEHDLVGTVRADLRPADEPLRWMIADPRAITETRCDHHWLRILDVPRCLEARRYRASGSIALVVHDRLGFADGAWTLAIDASGVAAVSDGHPSDPVARIELGVSELGSLLLGGVSASTLLAAGRVSTDNPAFIDQSFAPAATPTLTFWY